MTQSENSNMIEKDRAAWKEELVGMCKRGALELLPYYADDGGKRFVADMQPGKQTAEDER